MDAWGVRHTNDDQPKIIVGSLAAAFVYTLNNSEYGVYPTTIDSSGAVTEHPGPIRVIDRWGRLYGYKSNWLLLTIAVIMTSACCVVGAAICYVAGDYVGAISCIGITVLGLITINKREYERVIYDLAEGIAFQLEVQSLVGTHSQDNGD